MSSCLVRPRRARQCATALRSLASGAALARARRMQRPARRQCPSGGAQRGARCVRVQAHPWVCVLHAAPNSRLNAVVVERLVAFTRSSRLERALLNLVAKHLSRSDIGHLEAMFKALDTDGDGRAARGPPRPWL